MAGSYAHIVTKSGKLRAPGKFIGMIENLGDAYEMAEELYGMIWLLAAGDADLVEDARKRYSEGLRLAPGGDR